MIATISADIVRSTSLSTEDLVELRKSLWRLLDELEKVYTGFWSRIVRGIASSALYRNIEMLLE